MSSSTQAASGCRPAAPAWLQIDVLQELKVQWLDRWLEEANNIYCRQHAGAAQPDQPAA